MRKFGSQLCCAVRGSLQRARQALYKFSFLWKSIGTFDILESFSMIFPCGQHCLEFHLKRRMNYKCCSVLENSLEIENTHSGNQQESDVLVELMSEVLALWSVHRPIVVKHAQSDQQHPQAEST